MANLFIDRRSKTTHQDEWGHEGNDTILGGSAGDTLRGAQGNDVIHGNGGNDFISDLTYFGLSPVLGVTFDPNNVEDTLFALNFNGERVSYGASTFVFFGGNDRFYGEAGNDEIYGYGGNDLLDGGADSDTLYGGAGNDTLIGADGNDFMGGNSGNDYLLGGNGRDIMSGGDNDDRLEGGTGGDVLDGGAGKDTAVYDNSLAGVSVNLRFGATSLLNSRFSDAAGDSLISIENIDGSRFSDVLVGSAGANDLFGNLGNDTLIGLDGGDTLDGGAGIDTVSYVNGPAGVRVTLDDPNLQLTSSASGGDAEGDRLISIENLVGTNFADTLTGNSGANRILGLGGNDILFGLAGNDTLIGGDGNDTISGGDNADFISAGDGADVIDGGDGIDTLSFADNSAAVAVSLGNLAGTARSSVVTSPIPLFETDRITDIENVTGSNFADQLRGNAETNVILGGEGDDTLFFSLGNDTLDGGNSRDMLDLSGIELDATVDLASQMDISFEGGITRLRNIEDVIGTIRGDLISGSSSDNAITGGLGADRMTGRGGDDTFIFRTAAEIGLSGDTRDTISDFSDGDILDFSGLADEILKDTLDFVGRARFSGEAGEIRQSLANGNTVLAIDMNGDEEADARLVLTGNHTLTDADFLL
jgi:Ca2+-binding RTX toxin-like protein